MMLLYNKYTETLDNIAWNILRAENFEPCIYSYQLYPQFSFCLVWANQVLLRAEKKNTLKVNKISINY